ncbi:hemolysin family protein [Pseudonocardia humida]|uniref:HlyC/CorC family transporter n=1 Tax=Pseudonocardia humida TaxID=2800819 RepID=A0ABT1A8Y4_9PSEU|nr:hemolysin family protein [Pseudonocardia humida]MCO1659134.1 HlyC/CorC family transporter [Pseudonocardia humida]
MTGTVLTILLGVLVVIAISALTGYFVAQEFGFMAVDRSRLRAAAATGDAGARRALAVTKRTSFMLSGAQLGITVTGLVVGYVAEPMIGEGVGELLGVAGVPTAVGVAIGTVLALLLATVVQMVLGELFPKNLAIARPERVARALALSTLIYLRVLGWLIHVFDAASNLLLKAVRIEPVHDVEHAATPRDLEAIIDESREQGELPVGLSTLLDRVLDFTDRTAREAMIPRPRVGTVAADVPLPDLVAQMARGHSRYPVTGDGVDDVIGVVHLRAVLALTAEEAAERTVRDVMRPPVFVPESLPLPAVLEQLRDTGDELACVLDEYGGLAGVITVEDVAEELVGEITDEHDPAGVDTGPKTGRDGWQVSGSMHVDEVERLIDHDLPEGDYTTIGGLLTSRLGRLPEPGDTVEVPLRGATDEPERVLGLTVRTVQRRVAETLEVRWLDPDPERDSAREGVTEGSRS